MAVYDDKTQGIVKSGTYCFIEGIKDYQEVVFKTSYIVGSDLRTYSKITALFDLIVIGDVNAQDIEVKGNFTCMGNCNVSGAVIAQGKIRVNSIRAKKIEGHDDITAQAIDVDELIVEGNVIVSQALAVETSAESAQRIICGETAYGAGTISANEIITGEELDMDYGVRAIVEPRRIQGFQIADDWIGKLTKKYAFKNDYNSYLLALQKNEKLSNLQGTFSRWGRVLMATNEIVNQDRFNSYDIGILLSLIEITNSIYFSGWSKIAEWQQYCLDKLNKMVNGEEQAKHKDLTFSDLAIGLRVKHEKFGIGTIKTIGQYVKVFFDNGKYVDFQMDLAINKFSLVEDAVLNTDEMIGKLFIQPKEYGEWLAYLNVLKSFGYMFSDKLYGITLELLYSCIGIKSKFIMDRIRENGWKDNV